MDSRIQSLQFTWFTYTVADMLLAEVLGEGRGCDENAIQYVYGIVKEFFKNVFEVPATKMKRKDGREREKKLMCKKFFFKFPKNLRKEKYNIHNAPSQILGS